MKNSYKLYYKLQYLNNIQENFDLNVYGRNLILRVNQENFDKRTWSILEIKFLPHKLRLGVYTGGLI